MNKGCKKRLISIYFIGIILGFILAGTENNINQNIEGVLDVRSGYTGGSTENPTYEDICTGKTGHAEVIQIDYDPSIISYEKLLDIFWKSHDPTTLNRQGADTGTQYRSAIYFHSETQKELARKSKDATDKMKLYSNPIVTEITPLTIFYIAENYHQDYYRINQNAPYCQLVIRPKLEKLKINE